MDTKHFDLLPEEKRNAVLNAAFSCFGRDGYKKTAMSEIAAAAHVSKAALFHYFGTKKALYFYLFRFSCDQLLAMLGNGGTDDFIECVEISIQIKIAVMDKFPGLFDYLTSLVNENDTAIINELQAVYGDKINAWGDRLLANVDWSRLRPGISSEEARNFTAWVIDGYIKACAGKKDRETMVSEMKRYLALIKRAVYKEKYL